MVQVEVSSEEKHMRSAASNCIHRAEYEDPYTRETCAWGSDLALHNGQHKIQPSQSRGEADYAGEAKLNCSDGAVCDLS